MLRRRRELADEDDNATDERAAFLAGFEAAEVMAKERSRCWPPKSHVAWL